MSLSSFFAISLVLFLPIKLQRLHNVQEDEASRLNRLKGVLENRNQDLSDKLEKALEELKAIKPDYENMKSKLYFYVLNVRICLKIYGKIVIFVVFNV